MQNGRRCIIATASQLRLQSVSNSPGRPTFQHHQCQQYTNTRSLFPLLQESWKLFRTQPLTLYLSTLFLSSIKVSYRALGFSSGKWSKSSAHSRLSSLRYPATANVSFPRECLSYVNVLKLCRRKRPSSSYRLD